MLAIILTVIFLGRSRSRTTLKISNLREFLAKQLSVPLDMTILAHVYMEETRCIIYFN